MNQNVLARELGLKYNLSCHVLQCNLHYDVSSHSTLLFNEDCKFKPLSTRSLNVAHSKVNNISSSVEE